MKRTVSMLLIALCLSGCALTHLPAGQLKPEYQGVVSIRSGGGAGSGFVIGEDETFYYVATAAHVVCDEMGLAVEVCYVNGVLGKVVAFGNADTEDDWAIVRMKKYERRYRVYKIAATKQEARVRGVGYVYENGFDNPEFVVYHGRVVTLNWNGFIAHNGGVFPGCSGGPLLDQWGRAVGICSRSPVAWGVPFETAAMFVPATTLIEQLENVMGE